ncbi:hypothetical protein [Bacillus cereus]|uniref:hypothetical protein n=1 Tax=Bacillus cereus TaxID=1396 RepID=UPI0024BCCD6C|nr:hypothetical protein [Bacillus cereus]WHT92340.1 hypothetical protein QM226_002624 [Bacillus cereus]
MKKYRVQTENWMSEDFVDLKDAVDEYEDTKDKVMGDGVTEDSYVELVSSEDDFEDYEIVKRAVVVVDEEAMAISTPREAGSDWDYWAKWQD